MIVRYDSTAALRSAYIKHQGKTSDSWSSRSRDAWYNNETEADSLRMAQSGNTALVHEAETLLTSLDTHIQTPQKVWNASVVGPYFDLPEYMAGIPTYARELSYEMDETAPITILASTTSSAGIPASVLAKRGTVILALVMALSRIRPVSLHQLAYMDGTHEGETIITSQINTSPLDLATACYVLTSAGFARRLTYGLGRALNNFSGGWPRRYRYGSPGPYLSYLKTKLAPDPSKCLIIPAPELHDELVTQPLAWIQKQITHFTHMQEEEETV